MDLFGSFHLIPPVTYQGGKQRIADTILDHIDFTNATSFVDVCCGSGAVSLALLNRGYDARQITMIDAGPWGAVWKSIGEGSFSLSTFREWLSSVPSEPRHIQAYLQDLSRQTETAGNIYVFLLLQAGSFGGKAIWMKGGRWQNTSFRGYWQPTATSNRQSVVNPMMPMPATIYERMAPVVEHAQGITGIHGNAEDVSISSSSIVYIDPPYDKTTKYGHHLNLDIMTQRGLRCYVSEGRPLTADAVVVSADRKKGGISGNRKVANLEYLSCVRNEYVPEEDARL